MTAEPRVAPIPAEARGILRRIADEVRVAVPDTETTRRVVYPANVVTYRSRMLNVSQTDEFAEWLVGLRDREARRRILARINRIENGSMGDVEPVGAGVSEARINYGPGYRLYFVQRGLSVLILLCGGDKDSQVRDIKRAKKLASEL